MRRRANKFTWVLIVIAALLGGLFFAAPMLQFSLITPPIQWIKPYAIHIGSIDYSGVLMVCGPFSYGHASLYCPKEINRDIYFRRTPPPDWQSSQWDYEEGEDSWAWFLDYKDDQGCAPNVGIVMKKISDRTDPRTGIITVEYVYYIIIGCDGLFGDAITSEECGARLVNSYFKLLIHAPYHVLDVYIDNEKTDYYYEADGSKTLIIPIEQEIPGDLPIYIKGLYGFPLPFWIESASGRTYEHHLTIKLDASIIETAATETLMAPTITVGGEGVTRYFGTVTTTYVKYVPITTTRTVTRFSIVTTTVVSGVTKYVPVKTTVYRTETFTWTGYITRKTTVTITRPTTITKFVTKRVYTTEYGKQTGLAECLYYDEQGNCVLPTSTFIMIMAVAFLFALIISYAIVGRSGRGRRSRRGRR